MHTCLSISALLTYVTKCHAEIQIRPRIPKECLLVALSQSNAHLMTGFIFFHRSSSEDGKTQNQSSGTLWDITWKSRLRRRRREFWTAELTTHSGLGGAVEQLTWAMGTSLTRTHSYSGMTQIHIQLDMLAYAVEMVLMQTGKSCKGDVSVMLVPFLYQQNNILLISALQW